jgi:hypothetical protein
MSSPNTDGQCIKKVTHMRATREDAFDAVGRYVLAQLSVEAVRVITELKHVTKHSNASTTAGYVSGAQHLQTGANRCWAGVVTVIDDGKLTVDTCHAMLATPTIR